MNDPENGSIGMDAERTLSSTRIVAATLAAGPLLALGAVLLVPPPPPSRALVAPAAFAGIVALAIGYRLYLSICGRTAPGADRVARLNALRTGTVASLAVTEATSLLGVIAFHLSREPFALTGLAAHLILAGAVWPTRARVEPLDRDREDSASGTGAP